MVSKYNEFRIWWYTTWKASDFPKLIPAYFIWSEILQNTLFEFLNINLISILKSFITVKKIGISVHYFSKFWLFDPISKIPERYFRDWN